MSEILGFCIEGISEPICKDPDLSEFKDEIPLIAKILIYFKQYLPIVMSKKKDALKRSIIIDPKDVDIEYQKEPGDYVVILGLTDDNSSYTDDFRQEYYDYAFEFSLEAKGHNFEGSKQNLLLLKSGVKTLLVNMDTNLGLETTIDGFSLDGIREGEGYLIREGSYRFSVSGTQRKIN
jgi:hypothetical protein